MRYLHFLYWRFICEPVYVRVYRRILNGYTGIPIIDAYFQEHWNTAFLHTIWTKQMTPLEREYCLWIGMPEAVTP